MGGFGLGCILLLLALATMQGDVTVQTEPVHVAYTRRVAAVDDRRIVLLDSERGDTVELDFTPFGERYGWSADGKFVFASADSGNAEIYLWDGETAANLSQFEGRDASPTISADGRVAFVRYSVDTGGSAIYVWEDGTLIRMTPESEDAYDFPAWSSDGRLTFTLNRGALQVWDGGSIETIYEAQELGLQSPLWSSDGRLAFVLWRSIAEGAELLVWDKGEVLSVAQTDTPPQFAWSNDGLLAYVSAGPVYIWGQEGGSQPVDLAVQPLEISWHPDGRMVFTSLLEGGVGLYAWDGEQLALLHQDVAINSIAWQP